MAKKHPSRPQAGEPASKARGTPTSTIYSIVGAIGIVLVAIFYKHYSYLFDAHHQPLPFVCQAGYCHPDVGARVRTYSARKRIQADETILVVPRDLQIWDLDAVRNDWIQEHFPKGARHAVTERPLDGGAYLALYLWHRFVAATNEDDVLKPYYDMLPTDLSFHPVYWNTMYLTQHLPEASYSHAVVRGYRDMVLSEFKALGKLIPAQLAPSLQDYQRFRILVLSRSFGTGPPSDAEALSSDRSLSEELAKYKSRMGIDLSIGCRAMVPILDMYNSHPDPNVDWRYDASRQAFIITAATNIGAATEIYNSYGTYTDTHLLGKFGFVYDGDAGYTQASMASMHRMMDVGLRQQFTYLPASSKLPQKVKEAIARNLQFDDGFDDCIQTDAKSDAYRLKKLKLKHLLLIANDAKRWVLQVPPRNSKQHDDDSVKFDASKMLSTCRLIALNMKDYQGDAIQVLEKKLSDATTDFSVERQSDDLEYRAFVCMARLSGLTLSRLEVTASATHQTGTPEWTAARVLEGEMQSLRVLNQMAHSGVRQYGSQKSADDVTIQELYPIRKLPCEWEWTRDLAKGL